MIDVAFNTMQLEHEKPIPISKWEVWFMTPIGLFPKREDAAIRVKELNLDPTIMVRPVPVAIGADGTSEPFVWS